jgi:hypothetical protein
MITLNIRNVPTLFIKAFTQEDVDEILSFVRDAADNYMGTGNTVLFIDTPITAAMVQSVEKIQEEGFQTIVRDHHGIDGEPHNDRERQVVNGTAKLRELLKENCTITVRRLHPACSSLVQAGEFKDAVAIIADPDADGLTAAMKACGIYYERMDEDAAILDGEPQLQITGTPVSQLLAKGIAVIPSYDPSKPKEREIAHQKLFNDWLEAVEGNDKAKKRLESRVQQYDEAVQVAKTIAKSAKEVAPHVVLADTAYRPLFDPGTLNALLEQHPGCKITVVRKSLGPIAAVHGIQYSLAVAKDYQGKVDLRELVPKSAKSDPDGGVISNVPFLLHVSEDVWNTEVLPKLQSGSDKSR